MNWDDVRIFLAIQRAGTLRGAAQQLVIDQTTVSRRLTGLERALGSRRATVATIFTLTICLGLAAMVLRKANTAEALMLLLQAALIVIIVTFLEYRGRPGYRRGIKERSTDVEATDR